MAPSGLPPLRELHRALVAIPSVSGSESRAADQVARWLKAAGFRPVRSGRNVHAVIGTGKGGPTLLLNSHLDTVPPNPSWTLDPFKPLRKGNRLYGLGASDAKASVAAMLCALPEIAKLGKKGRIIFAATCDEETGGKGLEILLPRLGRIAAALIGEPTACRPYLGQRGLVILKAMARGKSAHASRPRKGINALEIAARDILRLGKLRLKRHPLMGTGSVAATMIQGGTRRNVIPAACEFWIDIRTTPLDSNASVVRKLTRLLESEIHVHSMRLDAVETPPSSRIARAALPFGKPGALMGTSDLVFCAKRGIPGVILGPGFPALSHAPDEYVTDAQLAKAAALYPRIVAAYLGSP